jgi:hypothetical protein
MTRRKHRSSSASSALSTLIGACLGLVSLIAHGGVIETFYQCLQQRGTIKLKGLGVWLSH